MTASIHAINARPSQTDTEKLLVASLQILRLDTTITMLEMNLTAALTMLKLRGADVTTLEQSLARALAFSKPEVTT